MKTQTVVTSVIRPASVVRSFLAYSEDGSVAIKAGSQINADELASVTIEDANQASSATIRAVNTLRLARMLPDVEKPEVTEEKDGKKVVVASAYKGTAFDYVLSKVQQGCSTASTFQNIRNLIACADLAANSGLKASPFAVKEAMGYLKAVGAVKDEDATKGPKLLMSVGGTVAQKLKEGVGVNAIRPVIKAAKERKPETFKKPDADKAPKVTDAPDKVALDLKGIRGRWDKLASEGKIAELRSNCSDAIRELAKLAGFDCTPIVVSKAPEAKK